MKVRQRLSHAANSGGFTLVELLVAAALFAFIALGMGAVYVSAVNTLDTSTTETSLQRQGTALGDVLTRHMYRATALQIAACRPTGSPLVTLPIGESVMYQRSVSDGATGALVEEFWCVYRYRPSSAAYPSLWRCPIARMSPVPQTCTAPSENLLNGMPTLRAGVAVAVLPTKSTSGVDQPIFTLAPLAAPVATTVDIRFALDLRRIADDATETFGARAFGFNVTIRN
jgi:prepilin-type N-terminal cleavage/methylation domain-containing protein